MAAFSSKDATRETPPGRASLPVRGVFSAWIHNIFSEDGYSTILQLWVVMRDWWLHSANPCAPAKHEKLDLDIGDKLQLGLRSSSAAISFSIKGVADYSNGNPAKGQCARRTAGCGCIGNFIRAPVSAAVFEAVLFATRIIWARNNSGQRLHSFTGAFQGPQIFLHCRIGFQRPVYGRNKSMSRRCAHTGRRKRNSQSQQDYEKKIFSNMQLFCAYQDKNQ